MMHMFRLIIRARTFWTDPAWGLLLRPMASELSQQAQRHPEANVCFRPIRKLASRSMGGRWVSF
jgi:hypothetical protein